MTASLLALGIAIAGSGNELTDRNAHLTSKFDMIAAGVGPGLHQERAITIEEGTAINVVFLSSVSSGTAELGQTVFARTGEALIVDGITVVPSGTLVKGEVQAVRKAISSRGDNGMLDIRFDHIGPYQAELMIDSKKFRIQAEPGATDAAILTSGALVGAVIGHHATGGNSGKELGALFGVLTAAVGAANNGEDISIASEQPLTLRFRETVSI